jgi:uncharacterized protein (DUF4415 family)
MINDPDNPEWTDAEIARARPGAEVLPTDFVVALKRPRGRPAGSVTSTKQQVTLRLDRDALDRLKAQGPGWQTRINEALRKAVGL